MRNLVLACFLSSSFAFASNTSLMPFEGIPLLSKTLFVDVNTCSTPTANEKCSIEISTPGFDSTGYSIFLRKPGGALSHIISGKMAAVTATTHVLFKEGGSYNLVVFIHRGSKTVGLAGVFLSVEPAGWLKRTSDFEDFSESYHYTPFRR
jgi:hypothetical protein